MLPAKKLMFKSSLIVSVNIRVHAVFGQFVEFNLKSTSLDLLCV